VIIEIWLLITAIVFTFVGISFRPSPKDLAITIIENTVDRLIADGYIKTRKDKDGLIELMKYNEE
jgi:hypothetical protein